ncbi:MAG: hypothetical protein NDF54_08685 [archaeon GB-1867-035]|nr:hypothetical protein [Candidatus Culexmicrobium profundum]
MVQRLALVQVLIKQPKVIFLDEPTAGLDPRGSMMYRRLVKRLNKEYNVTILLSSHLLPEVRKVCHKVGFLRNGRIVRVGEIDELLKNIKFKIVVELDKLDKEILEEVEGISGVEVVKVKGNRFYLTADNDVRLEISKIVFKHGRLIKTLRVLRPTLEEIFFSIMGGGVE